MNLRSIEKERMLALAGVTALGYALRPTDDANGISLLMANSAAHGYLRRVAEYRRELHGRTGQHSARQYLGPSSESIEVAGRSTPHAPMRDAARAATHADSPLLPAEQEGACSRRVNRAARPWLEPRPYPKAASRRIPI